MRSRPDGDPFTKFTVCPGEHRLGAPGDGHTVVWWSPEPEVLSLGARASFGLRRDDLIVKDVAPALLTQHLATYNSWRSSHDAAVSSASVASINVLTATEAAISGFGARDSGFEAFEVAVETVAGATERPGGARFGSLVHALLADIPLDSTDVLPSLAASHGRILGAEPGEVAAAEDAVTRVLAHPALQAAASAARQGRCHRETPVTLRLDTGALVEGIVDLAYEEDDGFVVVDFKTDRELEGELERYRRQVRLYASAIAAATGRPARAVLMRV